MKEGWTVTESVYYYWFITYTTIGFGEYVTKDFPQSIKIFSSNSSRRHQGQEQNVFKKEETARICIAILGLFLGILGLCFVSSVLNSIMAATEEINFRQCCRGRKIENRPSDNNKSSPENHDTEVIQASKIQRGNISSVLIREI